MRFVLLTLVVCLGAGCTPTEPPPPPVTPMLDDLSTWTVPEVVQDASQTSKEPRPAPRESPPTPAEKVYPYVTGSTYTVPVSVGFPLDIVFGKGEQVHNATDGDRAPQTEGQTRRGKSGRRVPSRVGGSLSGIGNWSRHGRVAGTGCLQGAVFLSRARGAYGVGGRDSALRRAQHRVESAFLVERKGRV